MMKLIRASEIASIKTGYQDSQNSPDTSNSLFSLIQGKDFASKSRLKIKSLDKIRPTRNPDLYKLSADDILFQARGEEHFAWKVDEALTDTLAAYTFYILRVKVPEVTAGFLAWWLNQPQAQVYFKTQAGTGMVSFVSVKALSDLPVPIMPIELQKKIETLNALQQKEESLLEQLKIQRKRLVNKLCLDAIKTQERT